MNQSEKRSQKRSEDVEAVVVRKEPITLVARIFNIPQRTVFDWLARYRQGRPKKISGDDMEWLYHTITMGSPLNHKLPFCPWSLNTIRAVLQKER